MVGSAILRALHGAGYRNTIVRERAHLDLRVQLAVEQWFADERPEVVVLAAARVGGIHANTSCPADFIRDNLQIQTNVIDSAWRCGARKLLFLGSSCIYPRLATQPIREDSLLTGPLEPTNEWYAVAKIAGLKMCQAYRIQHGFDAITAMPTNLYGPGDNFDPESSHVLPALIRRFHEAKANRQSEVIVWGTGNPRREFLHVDDLASACVHLLRHYSDGMPVNVGWGKDISIRELADLVATTVGYSGRIVFDSSRPDGTPRKLLDTARLRSMGWAPRIPLRDGVAQTYQWFATGSVR